MVQESYSVSHARNLILCTNQINQSTYFNVFLPSSLFSPSVLSCIFLKTGLKRPLSAQWPWLVISVAQTSSVIKYSCICFSDRQAESAHTFSFQKILSNLVKNIFCPVKPLFLILIHAQFQHLTCNAICQATYFLC